VITFAREVRRFRGVSFQRTRTYKSFHQYSTKRVKLNGKLLNPYIVYDLIEPDFVIYSLLERKVAFDVIFGRISAIFGLKIGEIRFQTFIF
jgi:hypothetical protein